MLAAFVSLLLIFFTPLAHAQTATSTAPDPLQAQIDESSTQIARLKTEILQLQTRLTETNKQKKTLQSTVAALDLNIKKLATSIALTNAQIKQKDTQIKTLSGTISTTTSEMGQVQTAVGTSLQELQVLDAEPTAFLLLAGDSLSSFFDEAETLSALRIGLEDKITQLSSLKQTLVTHKTAAQQKRADLAGLQIQLSQQKQTLAIARQTQSDLLSQTKNKESNYQALIAQKQAEEAKFEAALFELSSKLKFNLASTTFPPPGTVVLRWPLDNVFITQQFGKTVDSVRLYTSGTHDGVDLRTTSLEDPLGIKPVHAALSGVVFEINQGAVPACQYGKWILIKHPNGLATLYAHLSNINVRKGQTVSTGDVIGFSGNTGYAIGPHLHFTVYVAAAVSLKQYACKSGYTVTIPIAATDAYLNPLSYLPR